MERGRVRRDLPAWGSIEGRDRHQSMKRREVSLRGRTRDTADELLRVKNGGRVVYLSEGGD